MTIGERIKALRIEHHLSLEDLAKRINTTRQTVQRYETGEISNIPSDKIELIAAIFNVTPAYVMGWERQGVVDIFSIPGIMPLPKTVKRPRLGVISCGEPIMSEQNFDGYDEVPVNINCDFTLVCEGDSMIGARINDGDTVYIKQQPIVESGQIAAVLVDGTDKLLKRVYIKSDSIVLQAENPAYEPFFFIGENMNRVQIIGRAVGFTSIIK